jgi:hypothetical protein
MLPGTSKPMAEKLLGKVERIPFSTCWFWTGSLDIYGYGRLRGTVNNVPWFKFAHRASYEHFVGPIPEGKDILHHCDNPCCINPEHLYPGDPAQNGIDKKLRGRARTTPHPGVLNGMFGRTGASNPMFGKVHSPEVRAKISATKLNNRGSI